MKLRKRGHCNIKQRATGVWRQINRFSVLFQNEIEQYNFEESETFWYKLAYNINLTVPCKNKHMCTYCKIQDLCFALEWTVLIDKTQLHLAMLKKTLNFNFCWKSYISTFQLRAALAQVKKKSALSTRMVIQSAAHPLCILKCPWALYKSQKLHLCHWCVCDKKWTLCLALCDCGL